MRRHIRLLLGAVLALFLLAAPASAVAAPEVESATSTVASHTAESARVASLLPLGVTAEPGLLSSVRTAIDDGGTAPPPKLATEEWMTATTGLHSRMDGDVLTNAFNWVSRYGVQQGWMSAGNGAYELSEQMVKFATGMDLMRQVGGAADQATAAIGRTVTSGPGAVVTVALVVATIIGLIWRQARSSEKPWGRALQMLGVVAIMIVMTVGATASTGSGDTYKPGVGSPGWVVTSVNDAVSDVVDAPAGAIATAMNPTSYSVGSGQAGAGAEGTATFCEASVATRTNGYMTSEAGRGNAVAAILNTQWLNTGVETWKAAQFGSANPYADEVYCHLLNWLGTKSAPQQMQEFREDMLLQYGSAPDDNLKSAAWGTSDNTENDQSLVAWAACSWNGSDWTVRDGWEKKADGSKWITADKCEQWWSATDRKTPDDFNVDGKSDSVDDAASTPEIRDYLLSIHGTDTSGGSAAAFFYAASAVLGLIVYGGFAIAIILAKVFGVVLTATIFFILLASLASKNAPLEKVGAQGKMLLGTTVLAAGASMFLAIIVLLTDLLARVGNDSELFGPPGTPGAIIWVGLAPLMAVAALHMILTKVLKLPTVFKPSGAMAWGQSAGVAGGAALGSFGGSYLGSRAGARAAQAGKNMGKTAAKAVGRRALGLSGPGGGTTSGRRGKMTPVGAGAGAIGETQQPRTRAEAKRVAAQQRAAHRELYQKAKAGLAAGGDPKAAITAGGDPKAAQSTPNINPKAVAESRRALRSVRTAEFRRAVSERGAAGAAKWAFDRGSDAVASAGQNSAAAIRGGLDRAKTGTAQAVKNGGKYLADPKNLKTAGKAALIGGGTALALGTGVGVAGGAVVAGGYLAARGVRHATRTGDRRRDRQNQVIDDYRAKQAEEAAKAAEAAQKAKEEAAAKQQQQQAPATGSPTEMKRVD